MAECMLRRRKTAKSGYTVTASGGDFFSGNYCNVMGYTGPNTNGSLCSGMITGVKAGTLMYVFTDGGAIALDGGYVGYSEYSITINSDVTVEFYNNNASITT